MRPMPALASRRRTPAVVCALSGVLLAGGCSSGSDSTSTATSAAPGPGAATSAPTSPPATSGPATSAPTTTPAPPGTIVIADYDFAPTELAVRVGETVTWVNQDPEAHQIYTVDPSVRSEKLPTGASVAHAFDKPGTYAFYCNIHNFMKGTVTVS